MAEFPKRRKLKKALDKRRFSDLSGEEREWVLQKNDIIFQGRETNLKELLSPLGKLDLDDFIDSEVLSKLRNDEKITVGRELNFFGLNDECCHIPYIVRKLRPILYNKPFTEEELSQLDIRDHEGVVTIGGTAGTGKSTLLASLAKSIKEKRPNSWVLYIDLGNYLRSFLEFKECNAESVTLLDLLNSKPESQLGNLEKKIFSIRNKVMVLLDGVNKVWPHYGAILSNIIRDCQYRGQTINLLVTGSMNLKQGAALKLSHTLEPLSSGELVDYLKKYWEQKFHLEEVDKKKRCEMYAKAVIHDGWLDAKRNESVGIPLLLRIVAEILEKGENFDDGISEWEGCYDFLSSDNIKPRLPRQLTLVELYQLYIFKSLSGNAKSKLKSLRSDINNINSNYDFGLQILALETILDKNMCDYFTSYRTGCVSEEELLKFKIVRRVDSEVRFIHTTFGEYFIAACISDELRGCQNEHFIEFLVEQVLMVDRFNVVRTFFNSFIATDMSFLPYEVFAVVGHILNHKDHNYILNTSAAEGLLGVFKFLLRCCESAEIAVDINNVRALHSGIENGHFGIVECLIENDIDVNTRDDKDRTALIIASEIGNFSLVKRLIERGADVDCKDNIGHTALHMATKNGCIELMKYLLERGADINSRSSHGFTALHAAASVGDVEKVSYLLENGARVYASSRGNGSSVLSSAIKSGNLDVVKYLVEKSEDVKVLMKTGETMLQVVPCEDITAFRKLVQYLISEGMDINGVDSSGNAVLHRAIEGGCNIEFIKCLVEQGVNVPLSDSSVGRPINTFLTKAICKNDVDTVRYLMENGVEFNVNRDIPVIYHAILHRYCEVLKYLGQRGIPLEVKDYGVMSSLEITTYNDDLDLLRILVENGIQIMGDILRQVYGSSTCKRDSSRCSLDTVKFLAENGAKTAVKFGEVTCNGDLDVIKFLLERGATFRMFYNVGNNMELLTFLFDKNIPVHGNRILFKAANDGYLDIVKLLTEKGVNSNWKLYYCEPTALHVAAKQNHMYIVKYLLDHGAKIDDKDNAARTALWFATAHGSFESAKILLDKGADISHVVNGKYNAFVEALRYGNPNTVKLLVERGAKLDSKTEVLCAAFTTEQPEIAKYLTGIYPNLKRKLEAVVRRLETTDSETTDSETTHLSEETQLMDAILSSLSNVKYLIGEGVELNNQVINRQLLSKAVTEGDIELVKHLISRGCDINAIYRAVFSSELTALHCSTDLNMVKLLVENGANVNVKDYDGRSVLYRAIKKGNLDLCRFLVENGADINEENKEGRSLLHVRTYADNISIDKIKYLVEKGAIFKVTKNGRNVLHDGITTSHIDLDLLRYFIKRGVDVNCRDNESRTPLDEAVCARYLDVIDLLIENGAEIETENIPGKVALPFEAVKKRKHVYWNTNLEVIKYLVQKGFSVNSKNEHGSTLLHQAVAEEDMHIVKFLVDSGAEINAVDAKGYSPLHEASSHKNVSFIKYLLEKGARLDAKTNTGRTVLHVAASSDSLTAVKFFVENGVDVNIADEEGCTPLYVLNLFQNSHYDSNEAIYIAGYLTEKGADVNARTHGGRTPLHEAASAWDINHAYLLMVSGAQVNASDEHGRTPLFSALMDKRDKRPLITLDGVVKFLVDNRADLNHKANNHRTVLHDASMSGDMELVELLVEVEADLNARTESGRTPLHDAAKSGERYVVEVLVEAGADVEAKTAEGCTALDEARKAGHDQVVKFLTGLEYKKNAATSDESGEESIFF